MGEFSDKAGDVAKFFNTTQPAVYRLAREGRLPEGSYAYLNERTLRFNLAVIRQWVAEGGASKPPKKTQAVAA